MQLLGVDANRDATDRAKWNRREKAGQPRTDCMNNGLKTDMLISTLTQNGCYVRWALYKLMALQPPVYV